MVWNEHDYEDGDEIKMFACSGSRAGEAGVRERAGRGGCAPHARPSLPAARESKCSGDLCGGVLSACVSVSVCMCV